MKMFWPYLGGKSRHPLRMLNVQPLDTDAVRITLGGPGLVF